jgi:hypothetical protein
MAVSSVWNEARSGGIPAGHLFGLTMSTAGASASLSVAPGFCADSTGLHRISLGAALTKTTAAWAAGAGGALDTGAIAINTWYHWFVIFNPTTGASDVLLSLSPTAPTLPAGYTIFRRIGSACTTSPATWIKFVQFADLFLWDTPVNVLNTSSNANATLTINAGVPTNISPIARVSGYISGPSGNGFKLRHPSMANGGISPPGNLNAIIPVTSGYGSFTIDVPVDAGSNFALDASATGMVIIIASQGWIDNRGRTA